MDEASFHEAIAANADQLPQARFGIYRNNVSAGLATALAVRYPMLQRLLGGAGFRRLVADFAGCGFLPQSPVLIEYGTELSAFCGRHALAANFPFISELAELENRWWRAYHAAEAVPLGSQDFVAAATEIEGLRFCFHPSTSLLAGRWPVGSFWQALQRGEDTGELPPQPEHILVWRPDADVRVEILAPTRASFVRRLMGGACLAAAVAETDLTRPGFDLQTEFQALIAARLIIRIDRTT